jgi:hypothetical protein
MVCVRLEPFSMGNLEAIKKEVDLTLASDSSKRDDHTGYSALERIVYLKIPCAEVVELKRAWISRKILISMNV